MSNPNNCETCDHKKCNSDPELHCYMFKDEPKYVCMQHTGRKNLMVSSRGSMRQLMITALLLSLQDK